MRPDSQHADEGARCKKLEMQAKRGGMRKKNPQDITGGGGKWSLAGSQAVQEAMRLEQKAQVQPETMSKHFPRQGQVNMKDLQRCHWGCKKSASRAAHLLVPHQCCRILEPSEKDLLRRVQKAGEAGRQQRGVRPSTGSR